MIFFYGVRNYGKVDHVPGLFYVSTQFAYLQFIPLFPTGTNLIIDGSEQGGGFRGVKLGLSGKSVFFAYLRAATMIGGLVALVLGCIEVARNPLAGGILIAAGIASLLVFFLTYKISKPSPRRALRLAEEAGIAPEIVAQFFVGAGLMPEDGHAHPADDHARKYDEHSDARKTDH